MWVRAPTSASARPAACEAVASCGWARAERVSEGSIEGREGEASEGGTHGNESREQDGEGRLLLGRAETEGDVDRERARPDVLRERARASGRAPIDEGERDRPTHAERQDEVPVPSRPDVELDEADRHDDVETLDERDGDSDAPHGCGRR